MTITIYKSYQVEGWNETYTLRPNNNSGIPADPVQVILPDGYELAEAADGQKEIFDPNGSRCTVGGHDYPMLYGSTMHGIRLQTA